MKKKILCLMGPTASGKTRLALLLAQHFPMDLISVDSAYVYRGMDIGTAKPTVEERARAPHRLIDICEPNDNYSVGRFLIDVQKEIQAIHEQHRLPLLVGGTMLYFHALQQGMAELPEADPVIRLRIEQEAEQKGWPALHAELMQIDSSLQKHIHVNDKQRIQRALELFYLTGQKPSTLQQNNAVMDEYDFINIILFPEDRTVLHQMIADRFDQMLKAGFVEEVAQLKARGDLDLSMPSMRCVGYRQVWQYLNGEFDFATMRERGIAATRQLAKRQWTWLRRWPAATILKSNDSEENWLRVVSALL